MTDVLTRSCQDIVVAGVGGQGVLVATDVIANSFMSAGYDAKKSEVHGMAQRGGSVISHVRAASEVHSPLILAGEADAVIALEKLEALRYAHMVRTDGLIIYNTQQIPPVSVSLQQDTYPDDIEERLNQYTPHLVPIPALDIAQELGNPRVANTVLLGAAARFTDIEKNDWVESLLARVPKQTHEVNKEAFKKGLRLAQESKLV